MSIARAMLAVVMLAAISGCSRSPQMRPRLILQTDSVGKDFWLAAPYIVAVKVVAAQLDGPAIEVAPGGVKVLQLLKFTANIENVIKGNIQEKKIDFFFFAKLDQNPSYYLYPGSRYIVSLRKEAGVLRSWADATQLKVEVFSGAHEQKELPLELGPGATIAYILLTPGHDCDIEAFGRRLTSSGADSYASPGYTALLLARLQGRSNSVLRDSACVAMAQMLWFRPACLVQAKDSLDGGIRGLARRLLEEDSVGTVETLRRDPLSLFPAWVDDISQRLEFYTEDMRPQVRRAACESLGKMFPGKTFRHCK